MRWTRDELVFELRQDPARRVLFVEGVRDLVFWQDLFPVAERFDGVVYEISSLECPKGPGGERGRLIRAAAEFLDTPVAARVRFFADADSDRLLRNELPTNVILTGGRDLESYGLSESCID